MSIMYNFSFIDFGLKDFIRDETGSVLIRKFNSYQEADAYISEGGLDDYEWTNQGTRKWCWEEEEGTAEVPA